MSKKEIEKRKQERKQEKQKRKENRKSSSGSSFDDMIAYVDEFGNITDTPPETAQKEKIELEDIIISTPKKEDIENEPLTGRVEFYNSEKGFGFIKASNSIEKYFFHINNAYPTVAEGNKVTFELERGDRGMNAVKVTLI